MRGEVRRQLQRVERRFRPDFEGDRFVGLKLI